MPQTSSPHDISTKQQYILTIANQKGGVGKTTTAINLSTALAAIGKKTLLIDLDPQGNASTGVGISVQQRQNSTFDLLLGEKSLSETTRKTFIKNLDIIPAHMDLLGIEIKLSDHTERLYRLRDEIIQKKENIYDYILIDCPPSLNLLTLNAMTTAQFVLVPLQCEFFALEGLTQLLHTVQQIRDTLNDKLTIEGIILTMFDPRNNLASQVEKDVRNHLGNRVYNTVIPRNIRVSEAPSHGKPVLLYDHKCAGSQAYMQLASELIHRQHNH